MADDLSQFDEHFLDTLGFGDVDLRDSGSGRHGSPKQDKQVPHRSKSMRRPRIFAVFPEHTAVPPRGLEHPGHSHRHRRASLDKREDEGLQRRCSACLENACRTQTQKMVELGGGNGMLYEEGPFCHYGTHDNVSALLTGEVSEWPGTNVVAAAHDAFMMGASSEEASNDAAWLLQFYETFSDYSPTEVKDIALASLARVQGRFAFVIYDGVAKRVLAARDPSGAEPLFWGVTPDGSFMFGSDLVDLAACNPSATAFPAGSLYASANRPAAESPGARGWVIQGEVWPGELLSFIPRSVPQPRNITQRPPKTKAKATSSFREIKAIPRINSKGQMCGAVYRVASDRSLPGMIDLADMPPQVM